jgi:hypothetical protein
MTATWMSTCSGTAWASWSAIDSVDRIGRQFNFACARHRQFGEAVG